MCTSTVNNDILVRNIRANNVNNKAYSSKRIVNNNELFSNEPPSFAKY